mgnify:CR=1 FL=1
MDLEIKKSLTSNWFKLLQNSFCDEIQKLEKNKVKSFKPKLNGKSDNILLSTSFTLKNFNYKNRNPK